MWRYEVIDLRNGDCLDVLRTLEADSVDLVLTDPPYGLAFMGKRWDYDVPTEEVWRECLRVLKPGGHLLAFAGTRTQHRMAVRIEDAGFEIRDMIAWVYGSGFPKHAQSALKPAMEPITMARKPLVGTVAQNVARFGCGGLNIDECRVGTTKQTPYGNNPNGREIHAPNWLRKHGHGSGFGPRTQDQSGMNPNIGRWPANFIHDGSEEVLALMPETATGGPGITKENRNGCTMSGPASHADRETVGYADSGSAARFFYCAKASRKEREAGTTTNHHPTVKPLALMEYLVKLASREGATVLDPFMGSGTTGIACKKLNRAFIGVELDPEYCRIAEQRIANAATQLELVK
jgi:site-specific DNA-methyltransferase (adenine-specific)